MTDHRILDEQAAELERHVLAHLERLENAAVAAPALHRGVALDEGARFYKLARELVPAMALVLRRRLRPDDAPR